MRTIPNYRILLASVIGIACLFHAIPVHSQATEARLLPNVVFILADDLGWSDTGLYQKSDFLETPNIQRLARRGMLFTNAYSAHPLGSPTRSSIMTGIDPARTGFTSSSGHLGAVFLRKQLAPSARPDQRLLTPRSVTRLDTKYTTLAEVLKQNGYATGHFGKWHLGRAPYSPLEHGFDVDVPHWWGPGPPGSYLAPWRFPKGFEFEPAMPVEHIDARVSRDAVAFIKAHRDTPFFLNFWSFSVHGPWNAQRKLIEKYAKKAAKSSEPQRLAVYGAMVENLDNAVGRILDALDHLQLSQRTILVFFSDNGGNMFSRVAGRRPTNNAPLRGGKATIYDGGSRVPCAVVWPGVISPGTKTDAILSSSDWYPTLLEILDIEPPDNVTLDGVSQVPVLRGGAAPRQAIVSFVPNYYPQPNTIPAAFIRQGPWKLIRFFRDGDQGDDRFELYQIVADPGETHNRAQQLPLKVEQLKQNLSEYLARKNAVMPAPNPSFQVGSSTAPQPKAKSEAARRMALERAFNRRDIDKDGFLTLKEFAGKDNKNRGLPEIERRFKRRDLNGDSKLSLEEAKALKQ